MCHHNELLLLHYFQEIEPSPKLMILLPRPMCQFHKVEDFHLYQQFQNAYQLHPRT